MSSRILASTESLASPATIIIKRQNVPTRLLVVAVIFSLPLFVLLLYTRPAASLSLLVHHRKKTKERTPREVSLSLEDCNKSRKRGRIFFSAAAAPVKIYSTQFAHNFKFPGRAKFKYLAPKRERELTCCCWYIFTDRTVTHSHTQTERAYTKSAHYRYSHTPLVSLSSHSLPVSSLCSHSRGIISLTPVRSLLLNFIISLLPEPSAMRTYVYICNNNIGDVRSSASTRERAARAGGTKDSAELRPSRAWTPAGPPPLAAHTPACARAANESSPSQARAHRRTTVYNTCLCVCVCVCVSVCLC